MPVNTKTKSELTHRTSITGCDGLRDGGRQRVVETHDLIRECKQTGCLIVAYSQGSVCSVVFEEKEPITQAQIESLNTNGNGLSTRGHVTTANTDVGP